jgi:hypothetical protein
MKNQELAERWLKGLEDGSGRKATPEEEQRIREMADGADPNNPLTRERSKVQVLYRPPFLTILP